VPDIDLYVCGFPCQTFSIAGRRAGFDDVRGQVFWGCLKVIKEKQPTYFILENVKGLLWHNKENKKDKYGKTFKVIWEELEKLKKLGYYVDWKILNTKDYSIPQNRERVFFVGTKKGEFKWPKKKKMKKLETYVDWKDNKEYNTKRIKKGDFKDNIFIDLNFINTTNFNNNLWSPCINTKAGLWCIPCHRYANCKELLSLQGFPKNFKQVVSNSQMKKQIGNSMSINVLKEIIKSCLKINLK
tara:strand:- start:223 stop:948 length:726 start_codon:yes stop_codon:yes gene_type:complete